MQPIHAIRSQTLIWQQCQPDQRAYELRADGQVFATLRWLKAFGSLAQADTQVGHWTFKRVGFWRPRVTVREIGATSDILIFEPSLSGSGTIDLPQTRQLRWSTSPQRGWAWHALTGKPLLHFSADDAAAQRGQVTLEPGALQLPDLALLIPLGWYLTILLIDDNATGSAAPASE